MIVGICHHASMNTCITIVTPITASLLGSMQHLLPTRQPLMYTATRNSKYTKSIPKLAHVLLSKTRSKAAAATERTHAHSMTAWLPLSHRACSQGGLVKSNHLHKSPHTSQRATGLYSSQCVCIRWLQPAAAGALCAPLRSCPAQWPAEAQRQCCWCLLPLRCCCCVLGRSPPPPRCPWCAPHGTQSACRG